MYYVKSGLMIYGSRVSFCPWAHRFCWWWETMFWWVLFIFSRGLPFWLINFRRFLLSNDKTLSNQSPERKPSSKILYIDLCRKMKSQMWEAFSFTPVLSQRHDLGENCPVKRCIRNQVPGVQNYSFEVYVIKIQWNLPIFLLDLHRGAFPPWNYLQFR